MTALCGFAGNFWQLFLARMGVGIGEASLGPCAYSLIADLFPAERRGRAMAIYGAGVKVGAGLALLIGGAVIGFVAQSDTVDSWFGPLRSWQLVFLIVGLPGLLVALLALTMTEPRGRGAQIRMIAPIAVAPFLRANRRAILCHFVGMGFCAMTAIAVTSWVPSFYIRVHGYTASEIGWTLGLILLLTGTLGAYCGGALSDHLSARGHVDGPMRTALIGIGISTVFGPAAALQRMVPGPLRARVAALYLLVVTLISGVAGPTSVALATDYLFGDPQMIGWSLALVILFGDLFGALFLILGIGPFREAVARQDLA
jgi:predicted MFS family arabinose efflux permease